MTKEPELTDTETLEIRTFGMNLPPELGEDTAVSIALWIGQLPTDWQPIGDPVVTIVESVLDPGVRMATVKGQVRYRLDAATAQRRALHAAAEALRAELGEAAALRLHLYADALGRPSEQDHETVDDNDA